MTDLKNPTPTATISRREFREDRPRDYYSAHIAGIQSGEARIRYIYAPPDSFLPVESNLLEIAGPRREGQKSIEIYGKWYRLEWVD